MALRTIASKQANGMENTMLRTKQLLNYLATHPAATVRFHASDMVPNIHSEAYLSEANAHSCACRHFFMGWHPNPSKPIKFYGAFYTSCVILRFVVASTAKAKLGTLFLNCKQATICWLMLEEMGHPQPPTPIHWDNSTTVSIANNTFKRQRSRSMEMRFFGLQMLSHKRSLHQIPPRKGKPPLKNQLGIWQYNFALQIKLIFIMFNLFADFFILSFYFTENCVNVWISFNWSNKLLFKQKRYCSWKYFYSDKKKKIFNTKGWC